MFEYKKSDIHGLIEIYKEAVKKLPLLKFSWVIIASIVILAIIASLKLNAIRVTIFSLVVIFLCAICFAFSYWMKVKDLASKILVYILVAVFILAFAAIVCGFAFFIFTGKPIFFKRFFPDPTISMSDSTKINVVPYPIDTANKKKEVSKSGAKNGQENNYNLITREVSIQLPLESNGYSALYIDGKLIHPTAESTKFNPRIALKDYNGFGQILIVTKNGDSCWAIVPGVMDSYPYRIIPNCQ